MIKKKVKRKGFTRPKFIQPSREPLRKIKKELKGEMTVEERSAKIRKLEQARKEYQKKWEKEFEKGRESIKRQFGAWKKKPVVSRRILKKPKRITVDLKERPRHSILGERNIYFQRELDEAKESLYFK